MSHIANFFVCVYLFHITESDIWTSNLMFNTHFQNTLLRLNWAVYSTNMNENNFSLFLFHLEVILQMYHQTN